MQYIKKKRLDRRAMRPLKSKYSIIDLSRMLTYPRPAGSKMEEKYIHKFIDTVPGMKKDKFGNRFLTIGKKPTTVFASHTDTVHRDPKYLTKNDYEWVLDKKTGIFKLEKTKRNKEKKEHRKVIMQGKWVKSTGKDILGADDTTGNWLMLNLIEEKKPGRYIFHREEEIGRKGSEWIAENKPEMLKGIKRVISFDRKGYKDIITHQMGDRTASDEFAKELARKIGGGYRPDPSGSFTDSASYSHLVPECTNVSIGYRGAHSRAEKQNLRFARHLYTKLREIDFEKLPAVRKPEAKKVNTGWTSWYSYGNYWDYKDKDEEEGKSYSSNIDNVKKTLSEYKEIEYKNKLRSIRKSIDRYIRDKSNENYQRVIDDAYDVIKPKDALEEDCMMDILNELAEERKFLIEKNKKNVGRGSWYLDEDRIWRKEPKPTGVVPFKEPTGYIDDYIYKDLKKKKKDGVIE